MRKLSFGLLFAGIVCGAIAQQSKLHGTYDPGIRSITPESVAAEKAAEEAWFAHVRVLASDDLKGRHTGTEDFLHAVEYVESQFKAIGLKPAGTSGFRQPIDFRTVVIDNDHSSFIIQQNDGGNKELKAGSDVTLSPHIDGSGIVNAPAVFAGFGFAVPALGFDDVKGVDLRGKIAVVLAGAPPSVHGPLKAYFRTAAERWKALYAAGAIGVITISEPRRPGNTVAGQGVNPAQRAAFAGRPLTLLSDPALDPLPGLQLSATVSPENATALFAGAPHSVDEIEQLARDGKDLPKFSLAVSIKASTSVHETEHVQAPNVIALLEGSDPVLKKEYLVLSAHLDHLGVGRTMDGDAIYNGAMDNASGVASLIETAKALANGPHPKRSILFLALTGEEEGELGSQYFAHYPTVGRSQIIADLNMDMYLPLFPLHFLEVQGLGESTLGNDARATAQLNDIEVQFDKQPDENRFIRSDQASFVKYGIPGLAFKFGWLPDSPEQKTFNDWIKNRYHHPNDDLGQPISKEGAVHFDHVLLTLTRRVANAPTRPSWYPESFFSSIPRS
jgi:hypothetical protein